MSSTSCSSSCNPLERLYEALDDPLFQKELLRPQLLDIYSFSQPQIALCNLIIIVYAVSKMFEYVLEYYTPVYEVFAPPKRRNLVIYLVQTVVTTVLLIIIVIYGLIPSLGFRDFTEYDLKMCIIMGNVGVAVYVWELSYRIEIGIPLFLHHIVTIYTFVLMIASAVDSHSMEYVKVMVLNAVMANFEQFSYVGLFAYRLGSPSAKLLLQLGCLQSGITKSLIALYNAYWYYNASFDDRIQNSRWWTEFWVYFFFIYWIILLYTQGYGIKVLYILATRSDEKVMDIKILKKQMHNLKRSLGSKSSRRMSFSDLSINSKAKRSVEPKLVKASSNDNVSVDVADETTLSANGSRDDLSNGSRRKLDYIKEAYTSEEKISPLEVSHPEDKSNSLYITSSANVSQRQLISLNVKSEPSSPSSRLSSPSMRSLLTEIDKAGGYGFFKRQRTMSYGY